MFARLSSICALRCCAAQKPGQIDGHIGAADGRSAPSPGWSEVVPDKGLHHGHEGTGNHEEVAVEGADQLKERVIARHDLAGFDDGDMPLADAETAR